MLRAGLDEDLGGRAPADDEPVALVLRLELAQVLAQLFGEITLGLALLDVGAVNARDVLVLEHRRHGLDGLEKRGDRLEMPFLEDARLFCGGVEVCPERAPPLPRHCCVIRRAARSL